MFNINKIINQAKSLKKTIVFPEAGFSSRTLEAVKILNKKKIVNVLLVGDESALVLIDRTLTSFNIVNPKTSPLKEKFTKLIMSKMKNKGITKEQAQDLAQNPYYFSALLVETGSADGMIGGAETSTANILRCALQMIGVEKKGTLVSSSMLMYGKNKFLKNRPLLLSDCGIIPNPDAKTLASIAKQTAQTHKFLGLKDPKVAFLSYSTSNSSQGEGVEVVKKAVSLLKNQDFIFEGEMQLDSALVPEVCRHKFPKSRVMGDANILIFPDLNSGNIGYKLVQYIGGLNSLGLIIQGLKKPVNDLSRGCTVQEIIHLTAITALQSVKKGS